jgi:hypothetical protein
VRLEDILSKKKAELMEEVSMTVAIAFHVLTKMSARESSNVLVNCAVTAKNVRIFVRTTAKKIAIN